MFKKYSNYVSKFDGWTCKQLHSSLIFALILDDSIQEDSSLSCTLLYL